MEIRDRSTVKFFLGVTEEVQLGLGEGSVATGLLELGRQNFGFVPALQTSPFDAAVGDKP